MTRSLLAGLVLAATFAVAGTASGGGAGWPKPDARDRALLASVLHGMRTDLGTVRLTRLAAEYRKGSPRGTLEIATSTSVIHKLTVPLNRGDWDMLLIAHAYNEQCVRGADHCLAVYRGPHEGSRAGRSGVQKPYWGARALAHAIRSRFAAAKLRVTSIAFEHPNALAPIITVRSSHPRRAWNAYVRKAGLAILRRHSEGIFIQMFDARGRVFYVFAGSGNTGEGWCARFLHCPGL